jgi:hypothetical protein
MTILVRRETMHAGTLFVRVTNNNVLFPLNASSSSFSSIGEAGRNPAYRTSAFEAVCTLTPF